MSRSKCIVTDHALLRWLERAHGMDIDGFRTKLQEHVATAAKLGVKSFKEGDLTYEFVNGYLVTVRPSRSARKRREAV